jgi:hypothetical protein
MVFNTTLSSQTELPLNGSDDRPILDVETTWKLWMSSTLNNRNI